MLDTHSLLCAASESATPELTASALDETQVWSSEKRPLPL
jgi:hypothetical protein